MPLPLFQNTSCPSSLSSKLIRTCFPHHQHLMCSFPSQPLKTLAFGSVFLFASFYVILRTVSFMWLIHSPHAFPIPGSSHLQNLFLHSITGAPPPAFLESTRTKVWYYWNLGCRNLALGHYPFILFCPFSVELAQPPFVSLVETPSTLTPPIFIIIQSPFPLSFLSALHSMDGY